MYADILRFPFFSSHPLGAQLTRSYDRSPELGVDRAYTMWVRKLLHLQPQFSSGSKAEDPVVRLDKTIAGAWARRKYKKQGSIGSKYTEGQVTSRTLL